MRSLVKYSTYLKEETLLDKLSNKMESIKNDATKWGEGLVKDIQLKVTQAGNLDISNLKNMGDTLLKEYGIPMYIRGDYELTQMKLNFTKEFDTDTGISGLLNKIGYLVKTGINAVDLFGSSILHGLMSVFGISGQTQLQIIEIWKSIMNVVIENTAIIFLISGVLCLLISFILIVSVLAVYNYSFSESLATPIGIGLLLLINKLFPDAHRKFLNLILGEEKFKNNDTDRFKATSIVALGAMGIGMIIIYNNSI